MFMNNYHIQKCTPTQIDLLYACQQAVINTMTDKNWYFPSSKTELKQMVENKSAYVLFYGKALIGAATFLIDEDPLTYSYLGCSNIVSIEDTFILPSHQHQGLQKKIWCYGMNAIGKNYNYFCTVHPNNLASLYSAFDLGFVVAGYGFPYTEAPRLFLKKMADNK